MAFLSVETLDPVLISHLLDFSPVPKDNVAREPLPMIDPTWFKSRTKIPRQPKALLPVPHGGLKSLYTESYNGPSDVKAKENFYCPVDTPWVLPRKFFFQCCIIRIFFNSNPLIC